jgi:predicted Zn-dependent protease
MLVAPFVVCLAGCSTVPETGRRQWVAFDEQQMNVMGLQAYEEACKEYRVITGTPEAAMVQRVGQKIAQASGRDYDWEFRLLDAPEVVNAFCLPGGKVAVYTGILKVTQDEHGLAAVLGHEVAHATANHGNERMSQTTLAETGLGLVGAAFSLSDLSAGTQKTLLTALNAGATFGILMPYSRKHESEADEIGLLFMVRAGYDPEAAPKLWDRMQQVGGGSPPEFLSTHPSPENRAKRLRELIPVMRQRVAAEGGLQQPVGQKRVQMPGR